MFPGISFRIENAWVLVTLLGVFLFGGGLLYPVSGRNDYFKESARILAKTDRIRADLVLQR